LIEPVELNVVSRLAYSLKVQTDVAAEIQSGVQDGRSACNSGLIGRLERLHALHGKLLKLHSHITTVGNVLHDLSKIDPDCNPPEDDDWPF
jgi:hypothetical protein